MTRDWTDEQLSAFLDGELPQQETDELAKALESDTQLAARMERLESANTAYLNVVGEIDKRPPSPGLKAAMNTPPAAQVIPLRRPSVAAFVTEHRAVAAARVCAVAVASVMSTSMAPGSADPLATDAEGYIVASSPLHRVLETGRTGDGAPVTDGATATPRLTFASVDGGFCRQFDLTTATSAASAIACRDDGGWRPQVVAYGLTKSSGDYRTASAERSPALEAFMDEHMDGAPVNAKEEALLLQSGWARAGR
jgi:hypothetical protein